MLEQGLGTDGLTHAVFLDASKERKRAGRLRKQGVEGVLSAWWGLQGVVSGWGRWRAESRRAERAWWDEQERVRREREREREEMQDVDEEEEDDNAAQVRGGKEGAEGAEGENVDIMLAEDGTREAEEEMDVDIELVEDLIRDYDAALREERNSAVPTPAVRKPLDVDRIFGVRKGDAE